MKLSATKLGGEFAALTDVTRDYLDGMIFADEDKLRRAFHPQSLVIGHSPGRLEYDSLDVFIDGVRTGGALPLGSDYYAEIVSIDITGDVAVVKVVDDYLGTRYTDYLTMLKHDGRWTIINKTFFAHEGG